MSILNTVKNFMGFETDEDYYDDFDESSEDTAEEDDSKKKYRFSKRTERTAVVGRSSGDFDSLDQIRIIAPNGFNDSERVANEVRKRHTVIFNVVDLDETEARRVVDFIAGTVYGVGGNIRRIIDRIFVATPPGVNISTDDIKAHARNNSFNWNMM